MKTITQDIKLHRLLEKGEPVVVGLSGGADSVMLTHLLHTYGAKVFAVHINHQLRGEESMRDERFVKAFCEKLLIPCTVHRAEVSALAQSERIGLELAGREIRYRIFAKEAQKHGAVVATAHTLSDQAETVLFRLARGSSLKGLSGIPSVRTDENGVKIIRPLLGISRMQVEAYCKENGLTYIVDSSNLENDYARNLIRNRVMPALSFVNEAVERHLGEAAHAFAEDEDYLACEAEKAYTNCKIDGGLSVSAINMLHPALQKRVLVQYLAQQGIVSDRLMLQRMLELCERNRDPKEDKRYGAVSLPGGETCLLRSGKLYLQQRVSGGDFPTLGLSEKEPIQSFLMPSGREWNFAVTDTKPIQNVHKNLYLFCLDYDKIEGKLICRGRMPSDRISIAGRKVTKTVKKWMNEEKVPVELRENLFVLADEKGVIAVEGLGISSRVAVSEDTVRYLIVSAEII